MGRFDVGTSQAVGTGRMPVRVARLGTLGCPTEGEQRMKTVFTRVAGIGMTAAVCAGTLPALADNCTGTWHNAAQTAETKDLGNGVKLTTFSAASSNAFAESGDILVGGCTGYVLSHPDGRYRLVYSCARKNAAGDVLVDEGSQEPGEKQGTWKDTVATGALAKRLGDSGWWKATIDDGKVTAGIWGGTCK
jgi:hypothetical protein